MNERIYYYVWLENLTGDFYVLPITSRKELHRLSKKSEKRVEDRCDQVAVLMHDPDLDWNELPAEIQSRLWEGVWRMIQRRPYAFYRTVYRLKKSKPKKRGAK